AHFQRFQTCLNRFARTCTISHQFRSWFKGKLILRIAQNFHFTLTRKWKVVLGTGCAFALRHATSQAHQTHISPASTTPHCLCSSSSASLPRGRSTASADTTVQPVVKG